VTIVGIGLWNPTFTHVVFFNCGR